MKIPTSRIAGILLLAGLSVVQAAPNIPPSEQPGRERQRFLESPVERFMQPTPKTEPLLGWQCEPRKSKSKKRRAKQADC